MATSTTSKNTSIGSLKTDLESFKAEVQAGLGNLERNFEKLARELKELAEHSRRPINWGWIIGAAGLVMSVTTAIVRLGATGYIDTLARHESSLQVSHAADLVRAREDGREDEAFRQLEVRTAGWERNHKMQLAATKELLSQAIDNVEKRVTNGPMRELRTRLNHAEETLADIGGNRFTRSDALRELGALAARLKDVENEDYGRPEAERDLDKVYAKISTLETAFRAHQLMDGHPSIAARVADLEREVERLRGE